MSIRHKIIMRPVLVCLVLSLILCLCSCVIINNYNELGDAPSEQTPADPIEQSPSDVTSKENASEDDPSVDVADEPNEPLEPSEPTEPSSSEETVSGQGVWVTASGTKYHSTPSCSNMKAPVQMTEHDAQLQGYTPCKRCH